MTSPAGQGDAWQGNWEERLYARIRDRGFTSVTEFIESRPGATLVELADELGPKDVAAVQLRWRLVAEAAASGSMERCARSLLARALREELPEGWQREWHDVPGDPTTPLFRKAGALSSVVVALPDAYEDAVDRIGLALDAADIPEGWLPVNADDPLLAEIFRRHWREPG